MVHNATYDQEQAIESHGPYGTVFFVLLNFTTMEYIYATFHQSRLLPLWLCLSAGILTLVTWAAAAYFHLDFSRRWAQLTLIPAIVLSIVPVPLLLGLMVLAVTKAGLVGWYFMHLCFEGNWVYLMLIPAGILATVFIVALYPDIGMQPGNPTESLDEEAAVAPLNPGLCCAHQLA